MTVFGFEFLRPLSLVWASAALAVLAAGAWCLAWRARATRKLVAERRLARFLPGHSPARARVRLALAALALVFLALSLAGPVRGFTLRPVERRGLDLVVCLDTSRSMLVRDVRPDRLTRAKREVASLFESLRGDRSGLIAFSGDSRQVAPLTHDTTTLQKLLATVTPDDNAVGGTDLATAIRRALDLFDEKTGAFEVIVLVTDGEDLGGKGLEAANEAAERGVRVFVLGIGTAEGGKIPEVEAGRERFVHDGEGREVVSALGGKGLAEIADTTGGAYISVAQSPTPLSDLYELRIRRIEGREYESGEERVPHDRFQWFLALALACMLGEFGLRESRPRDGGLARLVRRKEAA